MSNDLIESQVSDVEKAIFIIAKETIEKNSRNLKKRAKKYNTKSVNKLVYAKYSPIHKRRGVNGGLSDYRNIKVTSEEYESTFDHVNYTVCFDNFTPYKNNGFKEFKLSDMIENGIPNSNKVYFQPRPFMNSEALSDNTDKNNAFDTRVSKMFESELVFRITEAIGKQFGSKSIMITTDN